jgi:hypothetical protein
MAKRDTATHHSIVRPTESNTVYVLDSTTPDRKASLKKANRRAGREKRVARMIAEGKK